MVKNHILNTAHAKTCLLLVCSTKNLDAFEVVLPRYLNSHERTSSRPQMIIDILSNSARMEKHLSLPFYKPIHLWNQPETKSAKYCVGSLLALLPPATCVTAGSDSKQLWLLFNPTRYVDDPFKWTLPSGHPNVVKGDRCSIRGV